MLYVNKSHLYLTSKLFMAPPNLLLITINYNLLFYALNDVCYTIYLYLVLLHLFVVFSFNCFNVLFAFSPVGIGET